MNTGKVKFFNETKGYGFIIEDITNKEHFTHITNVLGKIQKDDLVTFELQDTKRGVNAINVVKTK